MNITKNTKDGTAVKMNKIYEIHFSPTGGTGRVSKIFTEALCGCLGVNSVSINLLDAVRSGADLPAFEDGDICVVSVPSFAGRVPLPAVEILSKANGRSARTVLNVVYGNRAIDDTLLELRDLLEAAGFVCTAAMETVAEHSIFRQFGTGRPDADDEAELKDFARKTAELLKKDCIGAGRLQVPGNYPYRERKPVSTIPQGNDSCSACGLCAAECPVQAIPEDNPKATDSQRCFGCMRCVSVCPLAARDIPKELREKMLPHMSQVCSGRKTNKLYMNRK